MSLGNKSDTTAVPAHLPLSILIVDDEPEILIMLRDVLEEAGFVVQTASDGNAALALLMHTCVALVLTDLMMPSMTGLQLAHQLQSNPVTAAIPVLLMSAALPPHIDGIFAAVLSKPFALDELVVTVRQLSSPPPT